MHCFILLYKHVLLKPPNLCGTSTLFETKAANSTLQYPLRHSSICASLYVIPCKCAFRWFI